MTKLSSKERDEFRKIIVADLEAIQCKVVEQIKEIWKKIRMDIIIERGYDSQINRVEEIKQLIRELKEEQNQIESELQSKPLTVHQAVELGGEIDKWGKAENASFFGIPVNSQFDYDIVQRIKETVNTEAPAKYLWDLSRSSLREITMAGTFEEAQKIYSDLYSLDFRKFGVDIPPRLVEMQDAKDKDLKFMKGYKEPPQLTSGKLIETGNKAKEKKDEYENLKYFR